MEPTDLSVKPHKKSYTPRSSPRDVTNLETSRASNVSIKDSRRSAFVPVAPTTNTLVPALPYSAFLSGLPRPPFIDPSMPSTSVPHTHALTDPISVYR